jgi:predicted pyridoxine 5'-phosphate oxidase superfamily flavin-nucleotide-binding protein
MIKQLPESVRQAWSARDPVAVLTTVSSEGVPNTIYVSCCDLVDGARVLIGDSHFGKTRENLREGGSGVSFLFFAPEFAAYQLKGQVNYHTEGPVFEEGEALAKQAFELQGVVEINVTEVYKGAEKLVDYPRQGFAIITPE